MNLSGGFRMRAQIHIFQGVEYVILQHFAVRIGFKDIKPAVGIIVETNEHKNFQTQFNSLVGINHQFAHLI